MKRSVDIIQTGFKTCFCPRRHSTECLPCSDTIVLCKDCFWAFWMYVERTKPSLTACFYET